MKNIKVLFIDLETSPITMRGWKLFLESFGLSQMVEESRILSWGAKFADGDAVAYLDERAVTEKEMIETLILAIVDCDILIGHNIKKFDLKVLQYRAAVHGLTVPQHFRTVDTLSIVKKYFRMPSYKLEHCCNVFNKTYKKLSHKDFPGFDLWKECLAGNEEAWQSMKEYNIHDVLSLEELYVGTLVKWDFQTQKWLAKQGIGVAYEEK